MRVSLLLLILGAGQFRLDSADISGGSNACSPEGSKECSGSERMQHERLSQSLMLRTEALVSAVEQMRLEVDALVETAEACPRAAQRRPAVLTSETRMTDQEAETMGTGADQDAEIKGNEEYKHSELGLRMLQPVDGEIIHSNLSLYMFEAFLPAVGDVSFTITLDGRPSRHISYCSPLCQQQQHPRGCKCRCSGTCDCTLCKRSSYSEIVKITAPKGVLDPGIHTISVQLNAPHVAKRREAEEHREPESTAFDTREIGRDSGTQGARISVQSHFKVVTPWTSVFRSLFDSASPNVWEGWKGVWAPRFHIAGLQYSMVPHQAAGLGALWPGVSTLLFNLFYSSGDHINLVSCFSRVFCVQVAIHRPFPGEVFDVGAGLTLDVQIFDFDLATPSGHNRTGDGILSQSLCVSAYLWLCTLCLREYCPFQ